MTGCRAEEEEEERGESFLREVGSFNPPCDFTERRQEGKEGRIHDLDSRLGRPLLCLY